MPLDESDISGDLNAGYTERSRFMIEGEDKFSLSKEVFLSGFKKGWEEIESFTSLDNHLLFTHGSQWSGSIEKGDGEQESYVKTMGQQSTEVVISRTSIEAGDLRIIESMEKDFAEQWSVNMTKTFFAGITEDLPESQNTTLDLKGDPRPGLLAALAGISVGLNDDLTLSRPQLALPQSLLDQYGEKLAALEKDEEFNLQYGELLQKKHAEALIRHFETELKFDVNETYRSTVDDWLRQLRELV